MPISTWIRDLFGIRKDVIDTKKAKLEIAKLEDEEGERRGLIDLATLDDVKKYDPKVRELENVIHEDEAHHGGVDLLFKHHPRLFKCFKWFAVVYWIVAILLIIILTARSCWNRLR
jgi:hypothetical protein